MNMSTLHSSVWRIAKTGIPQEEASWDPRDSTSSIMFENDKFNDKIPPLPLIDEEDEKNQNPETTSNNNVQQQICVSSVTLREEVSELQQQIQIVRQQMIQQGLNTDEIDKLLKSASSTKSLTKVLRIHHPNSVNNNSSNISIKSSIFSSTRPMLSSTKNNSNKASNLINQSTSKYSSSPLNSQKSYPSTFTSSYKSSKSNSTYPLSMKRNSDKDTNTATDSLYSEDQEEEDIADDVILGFEDNNNNNSSDKNSNADCTVSLVSMVQDILNVIPPARQQQVNISCRNSNASRVSDIRYSHSSLYNNNNGNNNHTTTNKNSHSDKTNDHSNNNNNNNTKSSHKNSFSSSSGNEQHNHQQQHRTPHHHDNNNNMNVDIDISVQIKIKNAAFFNTLVEEKKERERKEMAKLTPSARKARNQNERESKLHEIQRAHHVSTLNGIYVRSPRGTTSTAIFGTATAGTDNHNNHPVRHSHERDGGDNDGVSNNVNNTVIHNHRQSNQNSTATNLYRSSNSAGVNSTRNTTTSTTDDRGSGSSYLSAATATSAIGKKDRLVLAALTRNSTTITNNNNNKTNSSSRDMIAEEGENDDDDDGN